ncbi:hypothetical protein QBC40DRAFT_257307 [Triangularia verruculosa]|uniref:Fungal N-terminal domain-containing protein n=1 Tax=Triangularia verruculosa TaxID=2587418 RepID=A0AAN6XBH1_9PEZI|nr:hypothetical protein QBC40DRAFT_257307 [Triangularia verruculosa]
MEVIASVAAVAQLIDQSITLIHHIIQAYDAIRTARKTLEKISTQLSCHRVTLEEVASVPDLNTPRISSQLAQINRFTEELEAFAKKLEVRRRKGKFHHSVQTIFYRSRDADKLADILSRICDAEAQLSMLMQTTHIRMTSSMSMGIQRIEEAQMNGCGERYATSLDLSQSSRGDMPMGTWRGEGGRDIYDSEKPQRQEENSVAQGVSQFDGREELSGHYGTGEVNRGSYTERGFRQLPAAGNLGAQKSQQSRRRNWREVTMDGRGQVEHDQEDTHRENYHHRYIVEGNTASYESKQVNGVIGLDSARRSTMASAGLSTHKLDHFPSYIIKGKALCKAHSASFSMSPMRETAKNLWKKVKPVKKMSHTGSELEICHDNTVQRVPVQVGKTTVGELKMELRKFNNQLTEVLDSLPDEKVLDQSLLDQLIHNLKLSANETAPASTSAPQSQHAQPSSAPTQQASNKMSVSNNEVKGTQDKFQNNVLSHKINRPDLPLDASVDGNKADGAIQRNINISETTDTGYNDLVKTLVGG